MNFLLAKMDIVAGIGATNQSIESFVHPLAVTLFGIAGIVSARFLVHGGTQMITSSGNVEKLLHAKRIVRNALVGLVIVLAAITLTGILTNTYHASGTATENEVPSLTSIKPSNTSNSLVQVIVDAITGLLQVIVESAAQPFISALSYFTTSTPLMSSNSSVFNLWLVVLTIADVLFILVVILLGFHVMSAASLGIDEIEFKHLIPQLIVTFVLMNSSLFIIDGFISLSNAMITALRAGFSISDVWDSLKQVVNDSQNFQLIALLIFIVFIILSVILIIYYILRLVTLYIGAVLSPLVMLLWLIPSFKDFTVNALRVYLTTIFVLFIHVVILALAASIFAGMIVNDPNKALDPIMSTIVGVATLLALLKTQNAVTTLALASSGARTARKLGGQFMNGIHGLRSPKTEPKDPPVPITYITHNNIVTKESK